MKRKLFILSTLLLFFTTGFAQDKNPRDGGRLETYKIAYLTKKLNLSSEEAQKFWPIYYKYMGEIKGVKMEHRKLDEIAFEEKIVNIRKKYKNEFSQALPGDRVNQFFKADKEFTNSVRSLLQDRELKQLRQKNNRSFNQ
jgi:hypothetical protein